MVESPTYGYKQQQARYQHYYRRITRFYQKPVAQVSTALLLTLFTTIFFAVFAIRPTLATVAELIKKIDDQREVLTKLERKSAALAVVQNEYALIQDKLPLVDQAFPEGYQTTELLTLIESLAAEQGIPIQNLQLKEMVIPQEDPLNQREIQSLSFSLSFEAPYPQLDQLLKLLSRLPRYITVESITFSGSEQRANPEGEGDTAAPVTVNVTAVTYYQ